MGSDIANKHIFQNYFKEVRSRYLTHDYTEGTLRTPFENFIKSFSPSIRLIHEPKRTKGLGAPDFKAFYRSRKVGFIETKDLDANLDNILESEQLKKYIESINNLILTDYCRFILIRNGQKIFDFNLFTLADLDNARFTIPDDKIEIFTQFINEFFSYKLPTISSAEELARELSKKAKLLKDFAKEQLEEDLKAENGGQSSIYDFYEGIKELIKDISIEDCADAYAQTVTYGLFLARKNCKDKLERINAASYIPKSVGIIKKIFINISGDAFPSNISWIIDDIVDVLNAANVENILTKIDKRGKKDKDPIIFFYEDFLNFYEPEKRKHMGVYYTPRPVVNFIVNSVNHILKKYFDKPMGFAEDDVHVLDPAIGTGTFFWIAFLLTLKELKDAGLSGLIDEKIANHILKHFYGFEILITPYVISHLKLTDLLQRWHYNFKDNDRLQVYLTNTLEPSEVHGLMPFLREITEESRIANQIKLKKPILAIIGNPPYAGISSNKGKWIDDLLKKGYTRADGSKDDGYYMVDGEALGEKKVWLQDDYVKFIRFAQWKIDKKGEGIVGFVTNHSYLDNPTFRGMRESLLQSFDRIYVLNLHGNAKKKEKCPDGSKDENVFDIQQGVAISLFIKNNNFKDKKIFYADLWGLREDKYKWLDRHTVTNVEWQEIEPVSPCYFFVPRDTSFQKEYENYWKITEIFQANVTGIITARDKFVIDFDKNSLKSRITEFRNLKIPDEVIRQTFDLKENYMWRISKARKELSTVTDWEKYFAKVLYRPFDVREIYFHDSVVWRTRKKVMQHMIKENVGMYTCRQLSSTGWRHILVTNGITDDCYVSNKTRERGYLFPLYLYFNSNKKPNLNPEFLEFIKEKYSMELSPEEIFYYIYAVLHSPTYRKKYEEFLQYDFPRIPFVDDYEKFKQLSELGKELVDLHLMKKKLPVHTKFDVQGSNVVEKVRYEGYKVFINDAQYFDGVPSEVWNFHIGGYQVLDKWLKSRKNRKLGGKDIEHFLQIVEIIKQTIEIMNKIDKFGEF